MSDEEVKQADPCGSADFSSLSVTTTTTAATAGDAPSSSSGASDDKQQDLRSEPQSSERATTDDTGCVAPPEAVSTSSSESLPASEPPAMPRHSEPVRLQIKQQNGVVLSIEIGLHETVQKLRELLFPLLSIPVDHQRLVFSGTVLDPNRTLASCDVKPESTVYVLNNSPQRSNASALSSNASSSTPNVRPPTSSMTPPFTAPPFSSSSPAYINSPAGFGLFSGQQPAGLNELLENRELMTQVLNSPLAQNLVDNPQFMRTFLEANPQLRELRERNPELNHILNDPQMLRQSLEMMRNPSLLREMMRSTDRAMINIEAIPGGFNALRKMYHSIQEPLWNVVDSNPLATGSSRDQPTPEYNMETENPPDTEALPNPWAPATSASRSTSTMISESSSSSVSSPAATQQSASAAAGLNLASIMRDPGMQGLMTGMMAASGGTIGQSREADGASSSTTQGSEPSAALPNPSAYQPMFTPQSLLAMNQLQQAIENMSVNDAALGPSNLRSVYSGYPRAENDNPEALYQNQLSALRSMGFTDTQACIRVLQETNGNLNRAIDRLLGDDPSQF